MKRVQSKTNADYGKAAQQGGFLALGHDAEDGHAIGVLRAIGVAIGGGAGEDGSAFPALFSSKAASSKRDA